jgi:hypothetical protein
MTSIPSNSKCLVVGATDLQAGAAHGTVIGRMANWTMLLPFCPKRRERSVVS